MPFTEKRESSRHAPSCRSQKSERGVGMDIQEMRARDLTIDEIAEITGKSRVTVFQELQP